jgi:hypothetical protein
VNLHHDIDRDELRRQLRDIDRANREALPRWRDALARIFAPAGTNGGERLTLDQKAALLGVPSPSRRSIFKLGGATFLGAAVLSACGGDDDETDTADDNGSDTTAAPETTEGSADGGMDLVLARTAASLEILAVDTYGTAIDSGLVTTQAVADAAMLFRDHHQAHADALNGVITDSGGDEVTEANQAVYDALVKPAIDAATDEAAIGTLAFDLESAAAQTYVFAAGELSTPDLRSTIMTIGGIEARHAAILQMVALGGDTSKVFPDDRAFWPAENPLADIDGALLEA